MKNFSKNLEDAVTGNTKQYASLNLLKNPFLPNVNISDAQELFVGRPEELNEVTRSIGDLATGQLPTVTILGGKGIGKTHFLFYVYEELKKIQKKTPFGNVRLIKNLGDFIAFRNEYFHSDNKAKPFYLLIDESENLWEDNQARTDLLTIIGKSGVKIIWAWNKFSWNSSLKKTTTLPKTKIINLNKLSCEDVFRILRKRILKALIVKNAHPITDEALNLLSEVGNGVPYTAIYTAEKCLHFALNNNKNSINVDVVREFFENYKINVSQEISPEFEVKLSNLTRAEIKVLREIYTYTTSYARKGITTTGLAHKLAITTASASVHLTNLSKKKNILDREVTKGKREVYYRIKAEYLIWIERFLQSNQGQQTFTTDF